jgi:hypothetical protein
MIIGMARGPIPDFPHDRPTIPDVVPLLLKFYKHEENSSGGPLHIVLDDGNIATHHVTWCAEQARREGNSEGEEIATLMAQMTLTQRRKLYRMSWSILQRAENPDVSETYCNQCDTWSPSEEWEDYFEYDEDAQVTIDTVVCPRCSHWHPPYDPHTRGGS